MSAADYFDIPGTTGGEKPIYSNFRISITDKGCVL
jgi:hypothetical protein